MGLTKAIEIWFVGGIMAIVLLSFLSSTVPIAQQTIDCAETGVFGMGEASKTLLGLIGFIFIATLIYMGVREAMTPEDRTRIDYRQGFP